MTEDSSSAAAPGARRNSRPPVDPQCQAILDAAAGGAAFDQPDQHGARAGYNATTAVYAPPTMELSRVEDLVIPGADDGTPIPVRVYHPRYVAEPAPGILFFHGGGWVLGDLESHDALCRALAVRADAVVIAVDYRLAPEHHFPAAVVDCELAVRHVAANAADFGVDPARLAVAGDSAGGNLAAVVARRLRDSGDAGMIAAQVLVYPATDFTATGGSLVENAEGFLLTTAAMEKFRDWYLASPSERSDPDASPLCATDLSGLPQALVQVAGYDPLRDEGLAYAERLRDGGVHVEMTEYPTMVHGFLRMGRPVAMAQVALDEVAAFLRRVLR